MLTVLQSYMLLSLIQTKSNLVSENSEDDSGWKVRIHAHLDQCIASVCHNEER